MKKKLLLIGIQLAVVTVVLILTVASFAWFTSNRDVSTDAVTINAAKWTNVSISDVIDDALPYMGQTGTGFVGDGYGNVDAPYKATKTMNLNCRPLAANYAVFLEIRDVRVKTTTEIIYNSENTPGIIDAFYFQVVLIDETAEETVYLLHSNGYLYSQITAEPILIDADTVLRLRFEVYFLDRGSYIHRFHERFSSVSPFQFSAYDFMNSLFTVTIDIGVNAAPPTLTETELAELLPLLTPEEKPAPLPEQETNLSLLIPDNMGNPLIKGGQ